MFLNYLKNIFTKKRVKKTLSNVDHAASDKKIRTVGIIFDETYFYEKERLIEELVRHGVNVELIDVLVFKNTIRKSEKFDYPVFTHRDLSWRATFDKSEVRDFIAREFDLLINYYDTEKSALLIVSNLSAAQFKVGFASVDKKLNHFMINTNAENYQVFTDELFKYLKILNKI
jgi:nitrogenase subunit NifH